MIPREKGPGYFDAKTFGTRPLSMRLLLNLGTIVRGLLVHAKN